MTKKIHISISTHRLDATVADYSARLGVEPCVLIPGEYALWRTGVFSGRGSSILADLEPGEIGFRSAD